MKKILFLILTFAISLISVSASELKFVQIDGLLYSAENENSTEHFKTTIKDINKMNDIDFVIFSGNNIAKPNINNLSGFLKEAKKLKVPYYVVLGQKDVDKQKGLSKAKYFELVSKSNKTHKKFKTPNYVFIKKGVVFIVADGSKEFIPIANGYYRPNVVSWVDSQLTKYKDKNVVIIQHYPLIPPSAKETHYTYNADEYLKMLSSHKNVKAVFSGHFDVDKEQTVDDILYVSTSNSPSYRVVEIIDHKTAHPEFWSVLKR